MTRPTGEQIAQDILREELLRFAYWAFKDEIGEGHEEEIVDCYLEEKQLAPQL